MAASIDMVFWSPCRVGRAVARVDCGIHARVGPEGEGVCGECDQGDAGRRPGERVPHEATQAAGHR